MTVKLCTGFIYVGKRWIMLVKFRTGVWRNSRYMRKRDWVAILKITRRGKTNQRRLNNKHQKQLIKKL